MDRQSEIDILVGKDITSAAVIGAGTMGGQIAALIASADIPVLLLDVVPKMTNDRDELAKRAIEKIMASDGLLKKKDAQHIEPGNIEDHLEKLENVDWIIECVPEDWAIKFDTYRKIGPHVADHALLSSNTSTIPLHKLKDGLQRAMQKKICITHFFNPPEKLPLLEMVSDQDNNQHLVARLERFADEKLGRSVVDAMDSPGFIANRIGMFWLLAAMEEAQQEDLPIETADKVMNGGFGFPKTGIFALADLIGIKMIPDICKSMRQMLPGNDAFLELDRGLAIVEERLAQGEKKKEFYHDHKEAADLNDGNYHPLKNPALQIHEWKAFLSENTPASRFAARTLMRMLAYAAEVAPQIAENIVDIDTAMRDGYGWKWGPFEMIDRLGAEWLIDMLNRHDMPPPLLLLQSLGNGFYWVKPGMGKYYLGFNGAYHPESVNFTKWPLALKTAGSQPVINNTAGRLWDIGEGFVCFEFTNKMGLMDERVLDLLSQSIDKTEAYFQGLIIGNDQRDFSAGLDIGIIAECAEKNDWGRLERLLLQGQDCLLKIRDAERPVVAAICGYAVGGGCELAMHCAAAQAHINTRIGLVETGIGVIPGWGGTAAHLRNAILRGGDNTDLVVRHALASFRQIAEAKTSANAEEALLMDVIHAPSRISRNRERLLPDARDLCQKLAINYTPKIPLVMDVPVDRLYNSFAMEIEEMKAAKPDMPAHQLKTLQLLAHVFSGRAAMNARPDNDAPLGWAKLAELDIMRTSFDAFMELVKEKEALDRIREKLKR